MAVALESIYHSELDDMPNVSRARTERQEWFKTTQSNFQNVKLALQAVGKGIFYDFTKYDPLSLPEFFVGKGTKLSGGAVLDTTTHSFRESPRLQELRKTLQDDVIEEDGRTIKLDASDIYDIRNGTPRGLQLLELITRKEKKTTGTTRSRKQTTQTPVVNVRMTRAAIRALKSAENDPDEQRRRRIVRALALLK